MIIIIITTMMMMMMMRIIIIVIIILILIIDYLGTTESGLVSVVGSSSKMEATSFPGGTETR